MCAFSVVHGNGYVCMDIDFVDECVDAIMGVCRNVNN